MIGRHLRRVRTDFMRLHLKTPGFQGCQHSGLSGAGQSADFTPGISAKTQPPTGRDGRIQLPEGTGGGVAGVGVFGPTSVPLPPVQLREGGMRHENLATHFKDVGRAGDALRDIRDGTQIGRDILANFTIAPGRALHKDTVFIAQGSRQSIDFGLGNNCEGRIFR